GSTAIPFVTVSAASSGAESEHTPSDPELAGQWRPISHGEASAMIDWIEHLAAAILATIGPPPPAGTRSVSPSSGKSAKAKWTREELGNVPNRRCLSLAISHQAGGWFPAGPPVSSSVAVLTRRVSLPYLLVSITPIGRPVSVRCNGTV